MEKQQSATFTISADTPGELATLLRRIADALDADGPVSPQPRRTLEELRSSLTVGPPDARAEFSHGWATPATYGWWLQRGPEFLDGLTPKAQRAVLFVARHAPRVPVADLARELDVTPGPELAGTLASIGYAKRRMEAPEAPFRRVRGNYEMDPKLGELFREFAAHEQASTPSWTTFAEGSKPREREAVLVAAAEKDAAG